MKPNGFVGYEDTEYYYLLTDIAHCMMKNLCNQKIDDILKNNQARNIEQTTAQMKEREERIRIMLEKSKNKDKNRVR